MLPEHRSLISAVLSAGLGATGLWVWPFPADNAVLRLIQVAHPTHGRPWPTPMRPCGSRRCGSRATS